MPTRAQHESALSRAEAAGNVEAIRVISNRLDELNRADQAEKTEGFYDPVHGKTGNIASPLAQGVTFGFADELMGAGAELGSLAKNLWGMTTGKAPVIGNQGSAYTQARDLERQRVKDFSDRNPATAFGAELIGGLATGGLGAVKAIPAIAKQTGKVLGQRAAPTVATALVGAGEGAVGGAGYSEGENLESILEDAGIGALLGGAFGGIGGEALGYLARRRGSLDDVSRLIESQPGNLDTAGFRVVPDEPSAPRDFVRRLGSDDGPSPAGTAAKDVLATKAMDQGYSPKVIAPVQRAGKLDSRKMLKMTSMMEKGSKDAKYELRNRPSNVAGNSLNKRVEFVSKVNRKAADKLEGVAEDLKGQSVDLLGPLRNFNKSLDKAGIKLTNPTGDKVKVSFKFSDIEDLPKAERLIKNIVKRVNHIRKNPDAYEAHRLKIYIDNNVAYGKSPEGLPGKMTHILKTLRHEIDTNLDNKFKKYDKVNTQYSETREALDDIQNAVGKKLDFSGEGVDSALGQELRKLMSNYRSRNDLLNAIPNMDKISKKYGKTFKDDIELQARFVDELYRKFGTPATTSLEGAMEKGVGKAIETATGGKLNAATELGRAAIRKAKGISDENAFKAMKDLLRRQAQ